MITLAIPSAATAQTESDPDRYSHQDLTKTLEGVEADVFYGGTMISSGSTVRGNVVVIAGSLDLQEGTRFTLGSAGRRYQAR